MDAVADGETVLIPGLLEHVERAGVHSGDSVGVFPPQTVVGGGPGARSSTSMERIVRALGVRGLVNAQFIVREDGVYLIEVNPRRQPDGPVHEQGDRRAAWWTSRCGSPSASGWRTSAGRTGSCRRPPFVAVKAPAFSTAKLRGRGPVARALHAVHRRGDRDPRGCAGRDGEGARGRRRSCRRGRGRRGRWRCSRSPTATRPLLGPLAEALARAGYRFAATPGTRAALAALGYEAEAVAKLGAEAGRGRGRRSWT